VLAVDAGNTSLPAAADASPAAAGNSSPEQPSCCQLLTPMLPFLKADSLNSLQMPVLIISRDHNGTLLPTKNRIHGSMCI
jgi:hypothetical protein